MAKATDHSITNLTAALDRGDVDGALQAVGLARRGFLASLAAAATVAAGASAATAASLGDDAKLVQLAEEIAQLRELEAVASAECVRTNDLFQTMLPEKPRTLLWRLNDPVRPGNQDPVVLPNGSRLLWRDNAQIRKLKTRKEPFLSWEFIGTDEQWRDDLGLLPSDPVIPLKGRHEHLFRSWPDRKKNARAAELVRALDQWEAAQEAALVASGYNAAEEAANAISDKMIELFFQMVALTPSSLEGYRAMASAVINNCWSGEIPGPHYGDKRMIARMFSGLTGVPIAEAA